MMCINHKTIKKYFFKLEILSVFFYKKSPLSKLGYTFAIPFVQARPPSVKFCTPSGKDIPPLKMYGSGHSWHRGLGPTFWRKFGSYTLPADLA